METLNEKVERILHKSQQLSTDEMKHVNRLMRADMPKEPVFHHYNKDAVGDKHLYCPTCGRSILMHRHFMPSMNGYCPGCGQRFKWTNEILNKANEKGMIEQWKSKNW